MKTAISELDTRRWFLGTLVLTLAFRFWLAVSLPLTGDEAYFLVWGRLPDIGYYDHPPMVGWLLALLVRISEAEWVLRLPAVLLPAMLALLARAALRAWFDAEPRVADLAAAAVMLVPINVWNVLITTDTPLALFSFCAALLFARAAALERRAASRYFAAAGVFLGLAFLSKYFAVLLGVGMLAWALTGNADGRTRGASALATVFVAALPAGLLNLWWNYESCWSNVMFNAINRHAGAGLGWQTPVMFVAAIAYLAAPFLWYGARNWRDVPGLWNAPAARSMLLLWVVPLLVFAALAPVKKIGLHWLLAFIPPMVVSLAMILPAERMVRVVRFLAAFALMHAAAAAAFALLPLDTWNSARFGGLYPRLVFLFRTPALVEQLHAYQGMPLAADNYSAASVLAYHAGRPVFVFGMGSSHARHDDIVSDVRAFDGRDILIVRREPPVPTDYAPYFRSLEVRQIRMEQTEFSLIIGRGFDYAAYRAGVLKPVKDRWYRVPAMLPFGSCQFCDRHFSGEPCGR